MQSQWTGERTGSRPKPPEAVAYASLEPGGSRVQSTQLLSLKTGITHSESSGNTGRESALPRLVQRDTSGNAV
jgi:hypothetical protein